MGYLHCCSLGLILLKELMKLLLHQKSVLLVLSKNSYSFNQIGCQIGSRVLLMIDALNEGNQATLWKERLPGLIKSLEVYPAIGLVVSVRDTYFEDVIPERPETSCSKRL